MSAQGAAGLVVTFGALFAGLVAAPHYRRAAPVCIFAVLNPLTMSEKKETEELLTLSDIARHLPDIGRPVLAKCASVFDLLPWHIRPDAAPSRKYYRLSEVRRVVRALEPLRAKEIPLKHCRAELERLAWYRELRAREKGAPADNATNN